ncbi:MAG TPA: BTAD domain-containing putative transcriptional regulator [Gemmatimonadaceae bacterium]|nr:BTAD domain-containing putative transcriptional regulator [Gemmatimonadaceae bacterium]
MIDLRTLGGLDLRSDGPLGKAARQPRRLAVMAILADAMDRGASRDSIIGLLWPDQDEESARNNLTQALYALRRDLGDDRAIAGSSRIVLDDGTVDCDLWRFRKAIDSKDWEAAVALYHGPFLAGFFVDQSSEFDRWVERVRDRLASDYARAVERAASNHSDRGDFTHAAALWRRLSAFDPYNARAVAAAAQYMRAAGDRAGALILIHDFASRMRKDLALQLDRTLVDLADAIRAELAATREVMPNAVPVADASSIDSRLFAPAAASGTPYTTRHASGRMVAAAVGIIAVGVTVVALRAADWRNGGEPIATTVVVLPFSVQGDSNVRILGKGVAQLISQGLDGVGELRATALPAIGPTLAPALSAADTSAMLLERYRLTRYVSGTVAAVGATVQAHIVLHDATRRGVSIGSATVTAPADSIFRLADEITRRLLGLAVSSSSSQFGRRASETTNSLPAFMAFLDGEAWFRASRFADAVSAFKRAVREDTSFALAYYRLVDALDWNGQGDQIPSAAARALALGDRLPWRERRLLEGGMAWRNGKLDEAETKLREVATRYPNDVDAWYQLSEVLFHSNAVRGREFVEAERPLQRVLALDPANRSALTHLLRMAAYVDDTARANETFQRALPLFAAGVEAEVAVFHATLAGPVKAREAAIERLFAEGGYSVINAAQRLAAYAKDLRSSDTLVSRAIRQGLARGDYGETRYWAAIIAAAQGQLRRAGRELATLQSTAPGKAVELRALLLAFPYHSYRDVERNDAIAELDRQGLPNVANGFQTTPARVGSLARLYLTGLAHGISGDPSELAGYADSLEHWQPSRGSEVTASAFSGALRALHASRTGRPEDALAILERTPEPAEIVEQFIGGMQHERFLKASLLERVGRTDEAVAVYGSLIFGHPNSVLTAVPAALRRARLLVKLGKLPKARADYRLVVSAWHAADPVLQPVVDSARAELSRLR